MKKLNFLGLSALMLLVAFSFVRCEKFKTINLNSEFKVVFSVNETNTGTNLPYSEIKSISIEDDEDLQEYKDKIKEIEVVSVSYLIRNYNGDPGITFDGNCGYSKVSQAEAVGVANTGIVDLQSLSQADVKELFTFTGAQLDQMGAYFLNEKGLKIYAEGLLSQGPASFDIEVYVYTKIKAEIKE